MLCRYAAYLASKLAYVSIPKYLNILRILHRELGFPNPLDDNWFLNTVLKGIKRDKGSVVKRKLPITPAILLGIRSQLHLQEPKDILFWAVCLVAFFGLFRKSNLLPATCHGFSTLKQLTRGDITKCSQGLAVRVKWSKTVQFRERQYQVPLPFLQGQPLCPVTALVSLMALDPGLPTQAPLFAFNTPSGVHILTQSQFTERLQDFIQALGLSRRDYSGARWG